MPNKEIEKLREEIKKEWEDRNQYYIIPTEILEDITTFWLAKLTASNLATREEVKREILEGLPKEKEIFSFAPKSSQTEMSNRDRNNYNQGLSEIKAFINSLN